MKIHVYYLLQVVHPTLGGVARSVLRRANLIAEKTDLHVSIVTLNFDPNLDVVRAELLRHRLLSSKVKFINLFEDLSHKDVDEKDDDPITYHPVEEKGFNIERVADKNGYRLYKNDVYVKYKEYDLDGRLKYINYFDDKKRIIRSEYFDIKGRIRRIVHMDPFLNGPRQTQFLDNKGRCFLNVWYDPKTKKSIKVYWFDLQGAIIKSFSDETELKIFWLEELTKNQQSVILHSELITTDFMILSQNRPHIAKVKVFHSNHFKEPYTYGAPIDEFYEKLFRENIDKFDAVVFLTNSQKKDVERQFGLRQTFHIVPHVAPQIKNPIEVKRDLLTCVFVGRFAPEKVVDHIIRAFFEVVKVIPNAKLEIWGTGKEEANYIKLIQSLGLENNIKICGFTQKALDVFAKAAFSVFTSIREGFGLTIAESMSVGTPVIAYDVNYGPREMIINGVNGYLIPPNDVKSLSQAMIDLFSNPKKCREMGEQARKIKDKFNEDDFIDKWLNVYKAAIEQKDHRIKMKKPKCEASELEWVEHDKLMIEGAIHLAKEINGEPILSLYIRNRDELVDEYFDLNVSKVSSTYYRFKGIFSISSFTQNGLWDLYLSFSFRNLHYFVRIQKGECKLPRVKTRDVQNQEIKFYVTKYGNITFCVRNKKTLWQRVRNKDNWKRFVSRYLNNINLKNIKQIK